MKETIFNPWFEARLYKGVILEGNWIGQKIAHYNCPVHPNSGTIHDELNIQMELHQRGYRINGIFIAESINAQNNQSRKYNNVYKIKGHIHDNFVILEYHPSSRKRTGLGAFILEVKNGGKKLEGTISFVSEGNMEIATIDGAILKRIGDE